MDHEAPRERRSVAVQGSCVCGTPGGVPGGSVCTRKAGRAGGRHEHPAGSTGVRQLAKAAEMPNERQVAEYLNVSVATIEHEVLL